MSDSKQKVGLVVSGSPTKPGFIPKIDHRPYFIFAHKNPTSEHILKHGIFERELIDWCKTVLTKDDVFIDVGSHCGTYSLSLAQHCKQVYAFEAQSMTFYQLCGGIALNQIENVKPINCAIGKEKQFIELNITSEDGGGSTLDSLIPEQQNMPVLRKETCMVQPLDAFGITGIKLIKIDVEGFELQVLLGAEKTIKANNYPTILLECWPDEWFKEQKRVLLQHLLDIGYEVRLFPQSNNMYLATRITKTASKPIDQSTNSQQ